MSWGGWVVFRKEVVDNIRDRRSMMSALLFPLLGPLLGVFAIVMISKMEVDRAEGPLELPVIGADHAPGLVAFLAEHQIETVAGPVDPEVAVKAGDHDVVLVIPEQYGEQLRGSRPAVVRLVVDNSRQQAGGSVKRVKRLLGGYGGQVGTLRLLARGVHPSTPNAVVIETVDVSTPESRAAMILAMLPYLILMSLFMGGMYIAIDTSAGELERGSLEPLLTNPVSRGALLAGKLGATFLFSVVALLVTTLAFAAVPHVVSTEELGLTIKLSPLVLAQIFGLFLPLAALVSAGQMMIATFSRSFKEAQTQLSFLMLVPIVPGMLLMVAPFKPQAWMMLIPTLSEQLLTNKLLRGDPVPQHFFWICLASTALFAVVAYALAVRVFSRERLITRR